ncbi:unnamed protein product [Triticum turgidum subsp. durum]|uniref:Uncharacterized protein n=2 Tax=Triticum TaxID=4564 RepID=A0A9R1R7V6_TRITD|nr:unnamed protein product [Triticum turgidum subsp. durum]
MGNIVNTVRRLVNVISEGLSSTVSPKENCSTDAVVAKGLERGPARDTHKSKELRPHSVPSENNLFHCDAYEKLINGELNLGCRSSPEASEDYKMIPNADRAVSGPLDARGCESTPKALLRRQAERQITNEKASIQAMVPTGTSASPDVKDPKTVLSPLTRSRSKAMAVSTPEHLKLRNARSGQLVVPRLDSGSQKIIYDVAEVPITPLVEQSSAGKALPSTPSQMIKTPIPYGRSPLPRNKDKVLSVATPETPKLRSSRSGRLIVPRLDPGTQNIIYDADVMLFCHATTEEVSAVKGYNSEPPAKRRSRCSSSDHGRLLLF